MPENLSPEKEVVLKIDEVHIFDWDISLKYLTNNILFLNTIFVTVIKSSNVV